MTNYDKELTNEQIQKLDDTEIDFSDIPELDATFWKNARLIEPDKTVQVTLRVKSSVLDYFKEPEKKGYQTRINQVLESYVQAHPQ